MILTLQEMLRIAQERGIDDHEIARITGRNYTTVWRWRNGRSDSFVFDAGIGRLLKVLNGDSK